MAAITTARVMTGRTAPVVQLIAVVTMESSAMESKLVMQEPVRLVQLQTATMECYVP